MVFKIEKTKNYTVMSNYHLRDKNLSLKAKGLLSFMLSLPEDWDYSLKGLCSISKENRDAIRSTLKELQDNLYLEIEKVRGDKGYFEYNYLIYEKPQLSKQDEGNYPYTENPHLEDPNVEKQLQINTNEKIDKEDKTKSSFFVAEEHNILTLELIERGYITKNDIQIFYYDKLFECLLENNTYKTLIQIIHYIVPRVLKRNFEDEEGNSIENKFGYLKNAIYSNIYRLEHLNDELW